MGDQPTGRFRPKTIVIDASGTEHLGQEGVDQQPVYVIGGAIFDTDETQSLRVQFRSRPKSSGFGYDGFKKYLTKLKLLGVRGGFLSIPKNAIRVGSPLEHKNVLVKYSIGSLISRFLTYFPDESDTSIDTILLDSYGRPQDRIDILEYLNGRFGSNLLQPRTIDFVSSREEPLVKPADWIAGAARTLALRNREGEDSSEILEILSEIEVFAGGSLLGATGSTRFKRADINLEFAEHNQNLVVEVLSQLTDTDPLKMVKANVLYTLLAKSIEKRSESILTRSLIKDCVRTLGIEMSEREFRRDIVGAFRDKGILILGQQDGLRLCASVEDFLAYVNSTQGQVMPMLARLSLALETVRLSLPKAYGLLSDSREDAKVLCDAWESLSRGRLQRQADPSMDDESQEVD